MSIGYDHGYDVRVFYRSLALDTKYMGGGCLETDEIDAFL